ncbi:MAG: CDP-2,3-bis-(O-geranylgeranyl)-sn-glycerol synthase [Promethearchaeota archaeon]
MPHRKELNEKEVKSKKIAFILALVLLIIFVIDIVLITLIYSFADWIALLLFSLLLIYPAYLSNAGMVFMGGGKPIDGGRSFKNGKRILGDHKTWNGFIKGPLYMGIPLSIIISLVLLALWPLIEVIPISAIDSYKYYHSLFFYEFYFIGGNLPLGFLLLIMRIILCSYGAAFGDLVGSFIKRRFNFESGAPFWVVDQLDFATFALIFISIPVFFIPSLYITPDINIVIFILILTPSISIIANTVAYFLGLKDVPW